MRITGEDLLRTLDQAARQMRTFAHEPEHYIDVSTGESALTKYPTELRYKLKMSGWETALIFIYSVDVLPDGRAFRHLSIQISVPGQLTQGQINESKHVLLEQVSDIARVFFPLHNEVGHKVLAAAPVPVVDTTREGGNVHFRTPVTFHLTVEHDSLDGVAGARGAIVGVTNPDAGAFEALRDQRPMSDEALSELARGFGGKSEFPIVALRPPEDDVVEACAALLETLVIGVRLRDSSRPMPSTPPDLSVLASFNALPSIHAAEDVARALEAVAAALRAGAWRAHLPQREAPPKPDLRILAKGFKEMTTEVHKVYSAAADLGIVPPRAMTTLEAMEGLIDDDFVHAKSVIGFLTLCKRSNKPPIRETDDLTTVTCPVCLVKLTELAAEVPPPSESDEDLDGIEALSSDDGEALMRLGWHAFTIIAMHPDRAREVLAAGVRPDSDEARAILGPPREPRPGDGPRESWVHLRAEGATRTACDRQAHSAVTSHDAAEVTCPYCIGTQERL